MMNLNIQNKCLENIVDVMIRKTLFCCFYNNFSSFLSQGSCLTTSLVTSLCAAWWPLMWVICPQPTSASSGSLHLLAPAVWISCKYPKCLWPIGKANIPLMGLHVGWVFKCIIFTGLTLIKATNFVVKKRSGSWKKDNAVYFCMYLYTSRDLNWISADKK